MNKHFLILLVCFALIFIIALACSAPTDVRRFAGGIGPLDSESGPQRAPGDETITCATYTHTQAAVIHDETLAGITQTLRVPASGYLVAMTLTLDINFSFAGDLVGSLAQPSSCYRRVFENDLSDYGGDPISFNDTATCVLGDPCESNTWKPDDPFDILGVRASGDWSLHIYDNWEGGESTLNSWSLEVCTTPNRSTRTPTPSRTPTITPTPSSTPTMTPTPTPTIEPAIYVFDSNRLTPVSDIYSNRCDTWVRNPDIPRIKLVEDITADWETMTLADMEPVTRTLTICNMDLPWYHNLLLSGTKSRSWAGPAWSTSAKWDFTCDTVPGAQGVMCPDDYGPTGWAASVQYNQCGVGGTFTSVGPPATPIAVAPAHYTYPGGNSSAPNMVNSYKIDLLAEKLSAGACDGPAHIGYEITDLGRSTSFTPTPTRTPTNTPTPTLTPVATSTPRPTATPKMYCITPTPRPRWWTW